MWDSRISGSTTTFEPSTGPHLPKSLPVLEFTSAHACLLVLLSFGVIWLWYRKRAQTSLQTGAQMFDWLDSSAKRICLIVLLSVVALVVVDYCIYIYPDLGRKRFFYRSALYIDCIFGFDSPSPRCAGIDGYGDYTQFPRTTYGPFLLFGLLLAVVGLYWDRTWGALLTRVSSYTSRLTAWVRFGSIAKESRKRQ